MSVTYRIDLRALPDGAFAPLGGTYRGSPIRSLVSAIRAAREAALEHGLDWEVCVRFQADGFGSDDWGTFRRYRLIDRIVRITRPDGSGVRTEAFVPERKFQQWLKSLLPPDSAAAEAAEALALAEGPTTPHSLLPTP